MPDRYAYGEYYRNKIGPCSYNWNCFCDNAKDYFEKNNIDDEDFKPKIDFDKLKEYGFDIMATDSYRKTFFSYNKIYLLYLKK